MEENQVKLQAMIAANARELSTISSQLHTGQGKINESIQDLDGDTQQVAANVVTVQKEQQQLQNTVAAGNEGLNRRIGSVEDNQRTLQGNVAQVSDVTQRTAADLTSLSQQHAALRQMVQTNDKQMVERLTALASSDRRLCDDIANVHTFLQTMATNLTAANASLKDQLGTSQESLTAQAAGLAARQQQLQAGVDALGGKADQTSAQVVDAKSSLQETLKVSRDVLTGQMAVSLQNQQTLQTDVRELGDKADKLNANIGAVATGQTALHDTVRANHEVVVTAMAGLSDRDEALRAGIDKLGGQTDRAAGGIASLTSQQQSLYEAVKANQDAVVTKLADVSDNQARLQAGVTSLDGKADAMASAQKNLQQTLQSHSEATSVGVAGLADGQQALRVQMDTVTATTGQTARDVVALNSGQAALQQAVQAAENTLSEKTNQTAAGLKNSITEQQAALQQSINAGQVALTARATELAASQQALKSGIDNLGQATQQVASDITTMAAGQNTLHQTLKAQSDRVNEQVAGLANAQKEMKASLDTLTATTGQASLDILALGNNQTKLTQTVNAGVADLGVRTDKVAAGVAAGQSTLNDALNRQGQAVSGQVAKITDGQQQMQSSLDTLTATAGQTALDVLAMTARQDAIQVALQSHDKAFGTQMAKLADNQQQMQSGLDTVTAITGQASLDTLAMSNHQGELGQAVQAGRQEMAGKLAALAQDQQNWSSRLDAAQAKVATIAGSIAALEQQIAKLQEALQTGIQGTTTVLGATSQQRQQFEAKVSQDIQAVIDSLAQLRQTQTSLQEQITQVQKCTQGQTDSIRSVIEQIKATPAVKNRVTDQSPDVQDRVGASESKPFPAEFRISAAAEKPQAPTVPEAAK
jgi:chromosome segregation ATPase